MEESQMPAEAVVMAAPTYMKNVPRRAICKQVGLVRADLILSTNLDFDKGVPDFQQKSGPG